MHAIIAAGVLLHNPALARVCNQLRDPAHDITDGTMQAGSKKKPAEPAFDTAALSEFGLKVSCCAACVLIRRMARPAA